MKGYVVKSTIRHNGLRYKKSDFIPESTLDEQSAKRLLFLNAVEKSYQDEEERVVTNNETVSLSKVVEETVEETLDLNFEPEELKAGAKKLGLEFAGNISKKKLIALIVENDKTAYFLDQLED
ncbi:hypothetical protein [Lysinibacillus sp. NPDC047702]|uniref:hypothetical protein n=1 Tax=unclassified Lysinibacillus TaxID=2636778 RepID=UPI003CFE1754